MGNRVQEDNTELVPAGSPMDHEFQSRSNLLTKTIIPRDTLSVKAQGRFDNSSEKRCMLIFDEPAIDFPTSFIVLPYELKLDKNRDKLIIPSSEHVEVASRIGECLLEINKATTRFYFWLQVKRRLNHVESFKADLRSWFSRTRTESAEVIADEIVEDLSCGNEFRAACIDFLEEGDVSHRASSYLSDPVKAAQDDMAECTNELLDIFACKYHYFYPVDEFRGVPVSCDCRFGTLYPLRIKSNTELLLHVFLPFMKLTAMSATSVGGLSGLAKVLGLSSRVPVSWRDAEAGLLRQVDDTDGVTAFAALQRTLRQRRLSMASKYGRKASRESHDEVNLLRELYREYDPMGRYANLVKVSDGTDSVIWTSETVVEKFEAEGHLVQTEYFHPPEDELLRPSSIETSLAVLSRKIDQLQQSYDQQPPSRSPYRVQMTEATGYAPTKRRPSLVDSPPLPLHGSVQIRQHAGCPPTRRRPSMVESTSMPLHSHEQSKDRIGFSPTKRRPSMVESTHLSLHNNGPAPIINSPPPRRRRSLTASTTASTACHRARRRSSWSAVGHRQESRPPDLVGKEVSTQKKKKLWGRIGSLLSMSSGGK